MRRCLEVPTGCTLQHLAQVHDVGTRHRFSVHETSWRLDLQTHAVLSNEGEHTSVVMDTNALFGLWGWPFGVSDHLYVHVRLGKKRVIEAVHGLA